MKPPGPIDPAKLPLTYHLTIVRDPERGSRFRSVVGTVMRGEEILRRKVFHSSEDRQEALDELNRIATQVFYFDNVELHFPEK